ncbi:MAG: hypothetical protein V1855_00015 [bacterium]
MFISNELGKIDALDQAVLSGDSSRTESIAQDIIDQRNQQAQQFKQTLDNLKNMSWEQFCEKSGEVGSGFFIDFLTFKGLGAALPLVAKIKNFQTSLNVEKVVAVTNKVSAPMNEVATTTATFGKVALEDGASVAKQTAEILGKSPHIIAQEGGVAKAVQKVAGEVDYIRRQTGTVWDNIKMTDVMYPNTKVPRSFELTAGNQKLWVHPNATEHLEQYITRNNAITHRMPINSQSLLSSFQTAVKKATENNVMYNKIITIDHWELKFSKRTTDILPVVIHALYIP